MTSKAGIYRTSPRRHPVLRPLIPAFLVGILMGLLAIWAAGLPMKWISVILVAAAAPAVVLLVNDIRKLILVVLIVDIPLGVDIARPDWEWHQGGPTGYIISLMTIVLLVGYGLWILEQKPNIRTFSGITVPALLYLSMIVLSISQASNPELSLFGVFLNLQFILFFLYLANHIRNWDELRLVMVVTATLVIFESIYMLLQYFFGFSFTLGFLPSARITGSAGVSTVRVGGTIGMPNSAAAYLAAMLILVLGAYASGRLISARLALPALGLGALALVLTFTRTAWGSLVIMGLILLPWLFRTRARRTVLPYLIIVALVILVALGPLIIPRLQAALTDTTRYELAFMAYNIIRAYPWGVGENNYDQVMSDQYAHPNWVGAVLYPVHNKYLLTWAEDGPQGLAAFILLLLAAAWQAGRYAFRRGLDGSLRILPASMLAALAGYAFHMTNEGFASRANLQILWLILALIAAINPLIEQTISGAQEKDQRPTGPAEA